MATDVGLTFHPLKIQWGCLIRINHHFVVLDILYPSASVYTKNIYPGPICGSIMLTGVKSPGPTLILVCSILCGPEIFVWWDSSTNFCFCRTIITLTWRSLNINEKYSTATEFQRYFHTCSHFGVRYVHGIFPRPRLSLTEHYSHWTSW